MGSRQVHALIGAMVLAGVIAFLANAVQPERAGATTTTRICGGGSISLDAKERRALILHNRVRKNRGLKPLCVDPRLTRAARSHAREMVEKDYFSHSSYNGESVGKRLKRFGYHGRVHGENIAGGSGTYGEPGSTFRRWMNSPAHKSNILGGRFRHVGVGSYTGNYRGYKGYTMYTVDFGARR